MVKESATQRKRRLEKEKQKRQEKSNIDPENYFYSLLLQYVPFYNESNLLDEHPNARDAFLAREEQLRRTSRYMQTLRERDRQLEVAFTRAHAFSLLENPEQFVEDELEKEIPEQLTTDQQFQSACAAMNVKQRELFNRITQSIQEQLNGSTDRLRLFVTGGAGVGKTFTFNAIRNQVNRCYGKQVSKVGAPTGVAARLVSGQTLHSLFKIPVQKDGIIVGTLPLLTGNYLKVMRHQWKDTKFLFIDEISMTPYDVFCMIDSRLRQLMRKENEIFGDLNVIVFGDLMQLPPIRYNQIFKQPLRLQPATHLWRLFGLVELTENMRQQGDTTFADLLNALRVGELNGTHFQLLMSKMLTEATGDFAINAAIRIYPTRQLVNAHNQAVLEHYRGQGNLRIYKIKSQDTLVDATRNATNVDMDSIVHDDINKAGALPKELEIFVGAKVMLRSNINVERGLVNGAIGNITKIKWPLFRRDQMYETDIPSILIDFGRDGTHLIEPRAVQFPAKFNYGTVERRMLPCVLCWACTVHKMQGCTVDHAVVYLGKALFAKGQAYVALSRVRSLEGLRIEELDCSKLSGKTPCNEDAMIEMERMRQQGSQS